MASCAAPRASGPRFLQVGEVESQDGYSTLYIYRTYDHFEQGLSKEVYLNDNKIVRLLDSGYTAIYVKPGEYLVRVANSSKWLATEDLITRIKIEPGTETMDISRKKRYTFALKRV